MPQKNIAVHRKYCATWNYKNLFYNNTFSYHNSGIKKPEFNGRIAGFCKCGNKLNRIYNNNRWSMVCSVSLKKYSECYLRY